MRPRFGRLSRQRSTIKRFDLLPLRFSSQPDGQHAAPVNTFALLSVCKVPRLDVADTFVFCTDKAVEAYTVHMNMKNEIPLISSAARAAPSPATTRTQSMAEPSNTLRQILERIRDDAQQALKLLGDAAELRALGWKCTACGHAKHFTRPVTQEVARPCPKCQGRVFRRV